MIVAGIPFNATLFFFGASELVGHLPIYGVMLALLIYGSSTRYAQVVSRLSVGPTGEDRRLPYRAPVGDLMRARLRIGVTVVVVLVP